MSADLPRTLRDALDEYQLDLMARAGPARVDSSAEPFVAGAMAALRIFVDRVSQHAAGATFAQALGDLAIEGKQLLESRS